MLRSLALWFGMTAGLMLFVGAPGVQAQEQTLVILNWSDYLDPELIEKFERQYSAGVSVILFSSDDNRTEMLLENDATGYDLILVSGISVSTYAKRGWLAELDPTRIPNLAHIAPRWITAFESAQKYAVPYFWGTTGIIYRSDLVETPITSWQQLFRPEPQLQNKIAMMQNSADMTGMALKALGYSTNSSDNAEMDAAQTLLMQQKPHVRTYQYIALDETSPILNGEIIASMMYSGDALMLQEHNENLRYVLPSEGGNIWVDYFSLGAKASNPDLAYAFLDFINEPENAAQQAQFAYYATPNLAAEALLPVEFRTHPVIYPDSDMLQASEFYATLPARAVRKRNAISARVLQ